MTDTLVELSSNPWFRQGIKQLGLPIPTPQKLARTRHPRVERPLDGQCICVMSETGAVDRALAETVIEAGANAVVVNKSRVSSHWLSTGEAYGRSVTHATLGDTSSEGTVQGLVFDATGIDRPETLRQLYDFFHHWLPRLGRCGRVVVIGRPPEDQSNPSKAAAQAGLDGFIRSVTREIGRKGSTAHVVYVAQKAEARLKPLLRFLMSKRSAFISGQPWRVSSRVKSRLSGKLTRPLENKTALITGAARGIGAATARLLAAEGARVICLDRPGDEDATSAIAAEVGGVPLMVDITDPNAPKLIQKAIDEDGGCIDIIVHNAGITRDKTLARMKPEWWDQAVDVNLGAVLRINEALFPSVLADNARIVCLSSVAGLAGNVGQTNYAASKAGLVGYVKSAAATLAKTGGTINAVAPGFIETRLTRAIPVMTREVGRRLSALGQGGEPHDVAELIAYLVTPGAAGTSGQVMRACGGMFLGA
ncbi:MAG: 3-oxoacyl-ACP reductase [Myxococcota bacterium]|nr:3-oxoacyl-ACP reductase [Myxococcota bacterium]